jgi:hypothetical protein
MIVADQYRREMDARAVQSWESLRRYENYLVSVEEKFTRTRIASLTSQEGEIAKKKKRKRTSGKKNRHKIQFLDFKTPCAPPKIKCPKNMPPFANKEEQEYWENKFHCVFYFTPFGEVTKGRPN